MSEQKMREALELCSAELFAQCADQPRAMQYVGLAREALAQREAQEPVAYRYRYLNPITGESVWRETCERWNGQNPLEVRALYTAAPSREVPEERTYANLGNDPHPAVTAEQLSELMKKNAWDWTATDAANYIRRQHRDTMPASMFVLAQEYLNLRALLASKGGA